MKPELFMSFRGAPTDVAQEGVVMKVQTVNQLCTAAHEYGIDKGFWVNHYTAPEEVRPQLLAAKLMLVVTEAAEACEALRNDNQDNLAEELADIMLRVADIAGYLGVDLDKEIHKKMEANANREFKHGKLF